MFILKLQVMDMGIVGILRTALSSGMADQIRQNQQAERILESESHQKKKD